jgi:hypothetical protein
MLLSIFNLIKRIMKRKKNLKIQENIHEESREDYPSWWSRSKMTSGKVRGPK